MIWLYDSVDRVAKWTTPLAFIEAVLGILWYKETSPKDYPYGIIVLCLEVANSSKF